MKQKISVISTCRVYEPLKILENNNFISIDNRGVYGYVHTTKEIIQLLENTNGDFKVLRKFEKFISQNGLVDYAKKSIATSDVVFVEISSIRILKLGKIYFRSNLIRDFLKDKILYFDLWWKDLLHYRLDDSRNEKYGIDFSRLNDDTRFLINNIECYEQREDEFFADMKYILSFLKLTKPVLISHFDMLKVNSKERVQERVILAKWLEKFAKEKRKEFYNPRYRLEEYGYKKGLLDNSHYTKEFENILSKDFLTFIDINKKYKMFDFFIENDDWKILKWKVLNSIDIKVLNEKVCVNIVFSKSNNFKNIDFQLLLYTSNENNFFWKSVKGDCIIDLDSSVLEIVGNPIILDIKKY